MISTLQLGLIALGVAFIAGLVMFNWWQERKIRREMVRRFDDSIDDVLMGKSVPAMVSRSDAAEMDDDAHQSFSLPLESGAAEYDADMPEPYVDETTFAVADGAPAQPLMQSPPAPAASPAAEPSAPVDSIPEAPVQSARPATATATATAPATQLPVATDPIIDEIAVLTLAQSVTGSVIRGLLNPVPDFGKPVRWFGWSQDAWLPLTREFEQRAFSGIVGALQLADRAGSIQADGLLGFQDQVEHLATELNAVLNWLEPRDTLRYANMLDQFCIEVDVTVTLHITAGIEGPFAGTKLRGLAEAAGLTLKEDGRFHQLNDAGETLYTLSNADQRPLTEESLRTAMLHDMVLMLDVPRVAKGGEVFRQMAMFGSRLETTLNARLTDTSRRALGEVQLEQIRNQIHTIHNKLLAQRITPGGASALRLFS